MMIFTEIGRCISHQKSWVRHEPTIAEILSDPIVIAVMKADRVDSAALEAELAGIAKSPAASAQGGRNGCRF
jgi:hypothetical protein